MPIIAVTRLRLRDPALLDEFLTATVAVLEQAKIHVAISARTSSPTRTTLGKHSSHSHAVMGNAGFDGDCP